MRILSLIYSLAGGGGRVAADLIRGLSSCQHKIFHIGEDPQFSTGQDSELKRLNVPVKRVLNNRLAKELDEFKPHIVLYHWWPLPSNTYDPNIIKRRAPSILISHYNAPPPEGFDFYVAVSRFGASFMRALPHRKVFIIHNGVDTTRYRFPKEPHDGFINGRISSLEAKKIPLDYPAFLASFDIPNMKSVIVGDGPRRADLIAISQKLNSSHSFEFPGRLDNDSVRKLLATFDVSVYLTDTHLEVHSISLIEKALAGIVIIGEPRGGIPEQVVHCETGFLSHNRNELKAFCEKLYRDRELLDEMSRAAREFANRFSLENMAEKYRSLIEDIVLR
ncbi:MAG: hypothetical protein Kow0090_23330 [Myxococcota bacterium]